MSQGSFKSFSARIEKAGINPYVSVPLEISKAFGKRGYIAVRGSLKTHP